MAGTDGDRSMIRPNMGQIRTISNAWHLIKSRWIATPSAQAQASSANDTRNHPEPYTQSRNGQTELCSPERGLQTGVAGESEAEPSPNTERAMSGAIADRTARIAWAGSDSE